MRSLYLAKFPLPSRTAFALVVAESEAEARELAKCVTVERVGVGRKGVVLVGEIIQKWEKRQ